MPRERFSWACSRDIFRGRLIAATSRSSLLSSPRGWSAATFTISFCSIREHLSFAIADVSGKGVPAALFMAMTKEVLHTATLRYRNALDRVFNEANDKISAASEELGAGGTNMMFVTVFAGILDLTSGMLVYVNAGHDSPFVIRAGAEPENFPLAGGPPLGTVDDFQYSIEQRHLAPGEMVLAYTDGVTEAQDSHQTLYSAARLKQLLGSAPATGAKAVVDFVRDDVRRFAAGAEQADDITLLAVRWLGPASSG